MAEAISSINLRLSQLLGDEEIGQVAQTQTSGPAAPSETYFKDSPFEDVLSKAVDALSGVSKAEIKADQLIQQYVQGKADLQDVMIASSKASVMVQLAVTTINLAINTFKEITQMQV